MRQHDHRPEYNDNDEAQEIADIITDLVQSASEDKETIKSVLTTMTATIKYFQEKSRQWKIKAHHAKEIIAMKVIVGLTVELEIITTPALPATTKRLVIKVM